MATSSASQRPLRDAFPVMSDAEFAAAVHGVQRGVNQPWPCCAEVLSMRQPPSATFEEHIVKANHSIRFCVQDLRKAHNVAAEFVGNGCDFLYVEMLLKEAVELEQKLGTLVGMMEHNQ